MCDSQETLDEALDEAYGNGYLDAIEDTGVAQTGPPTQADADWYWHHVALAQDRPPARKGESPMEGQMTIDQVVEPWGEGSSTQVRSWAEENEVHVVDVVEGCWCGEVHE